MRNTERVDYHAEIRELSGALEGMQYGLFIDNERRATAGIDGEALSELVRLVDTTREEIAEDLKKALRDLFRNELDKVQIKKLTRNRGLNFVAEYIYRALDEVQVGLVEYNVASGVTGPDSVPTIVRNKMRSKVHAQLTPK